MTVELHPVLLTHASGRFAEGVFSLDADIDEDLCRLSFRFVDGDYSACADDYFEAMCQIRQQLEVYGFQIACFGSSRNVYPSSMMRNMGTRGQQAYKLYLGVSAKLSDV